MKIKKQPYTALLIISLLSIIFHGCAAPLAFEDDPRFAKLIRADATSRTEMVGDLLAGSEDERQLVTDFLERAEDSKFDVNRLFLAIVLLDGSETPTEEYLGLVHATTLDNNLWPMFSLIHNWMDVPGVKLINDGLGSAYDNNGKLLNYNALILQPWQRASCAMMIGKRSSVYLDYSECGTRDNRELFTEGIFSDLGNAAAAYLATKLIDRNLRAARFAADALRALRCPGAVEAMIAALPRTPVTLNLVENLDSLGRGDKKVKKAFRKLFENANVNQLVGAITGITLTRNSTLAPKVVKHLLDKDRWVRVAAAAYFIEVPYEGAKENLIRLAGLNPKDCGQITFAAQALSYIDTKKAVEIFQTVQHKDCIGDYCQNERYKEIWHFSPEAAVILLRKVIKNHEAGRELGENIKDIYDLEDALAGLMRGYFYFELESEEFKNSVTEHFGEGLEKWWKKNKGKSVDTIRYEALLRGFDIAIKKLPGDEHLGVTDIEGILYCFIPYIGPKGRCLDEEVSQKELVHNLKRLRKYVVKEWNNFRYREKTSYIPTLIYHRGLFEWERLPGKQPAKAPAKQP